MRFNPRSPHGVRSVRSVRSLQAVRTLGTSRRLWSSLLPALMLSGCNGSGSDLTDSSSSSSGTSSNQSAAGLWTGTDSNSGLALTGIVNAAGSADFIRSDGVQYVGTVQIAGSSLVATLDGYTQFDTQFSDGSISGVGSLNATVSTGSSISGTLSFTTSGNTASSSSWTLSYDALYTDGSSLSAISGNYSDSSTDDPSSGATVSISGAGVLSAQNSSDDCVLNGQVTAPDTSYDLYQVSYSLSNCSGAEAVLNGIEFTGFAILNTGVSPQQVVIGVSGKNSAGTYYGIVSGLTAN